MIVIGIDPGTASTGYGVVLVGHGLPFWLASTIYVTASILLFRRLSRDLGKQVQGCHGDFEDVWRSGVDKPECGEQGLSVCIRQGVEPTENRPH